MTYTYAIKVKIIKNIVGFETLDNRWKEQFIRSLKKKDFQLPILLSIFLL